MFYPARWSEIILQQYACRLGIDHTTIYLERFFRNLLLGDKWDLRNRYLYVNASEEWKVQPLRPLAIPRFPSASTAEILADSQRISGIYVAEQ